MLSLFVAVMSACSNSPPGPIDPAEIEAVLTTNPEAPLAAKPVELVASFPGANLSKSTSGLTFEIRVNEKAELLEANNAGQDEFSSSFTFPKAGTYDVYLHLYTEDVHLTKKKQVVVQ
ncbi:hypothetical protein [Paenibacillus sp. 2TAB19]|uniref:hypothetical protein n=1 Tax=Paenibacillus sp. 2TAB19 TaxID=3233003 RepID=UPI003F966ECB